jgi:hypothetical protein
MTARHRPGGRDFFRERNKLYRPPSVARRRLTGWHSLLEARVNQGEAALIYKDSPDSALSRELTDTWDWVERVC